MKLMLKAKKRYELVMYKIISKLMPEFWIKTLVAFHCIYNFDPH